MQPAEVVDEAPPAHELDAALVVLQQQLRLAVVDVAVADDVEDVAAVLQHLGQHRERGRPVAPVDVGEHGRRLDRAEAARARCQLVGDVDGLHRLAAVGVVGARVGDDDRRRQLVARLQRHPPPVGARQVAREHDVLVGRERSAVGRLQRLPAHVVQLPRARRQQQPQAQDHALGGGDRERLVERAADVGSANRRSPSSRP